MTSEVREADCLVGLAALQDCCADLVYLDPPFFTQRDHKLSSRDRSASFSFSDVWSSEDAYSEFLASRLVETKRILKPTGSIFFHCDRNANHIARRLLDEIFGPTNGQSEIIWTYRRWSNSQRGLNPAHQTIHFYSKSSSFKFNGILQDYSPSTNLDQILQRRVRADDGKAAYQRDETGRAVLNGTKRGVPLSDVWDIPFLNPKALERVGYPTQKPLLLLERIIELVTDEGDFVVDPFCGSGTTIVAAQMLNRKALGFDISTEAVAICQKRLSNPIRTESELLKRGRESYATADERALGLLYGLRVAPVQRNRGIDAFLQEDSDGLIIPIRVQRINEPLSVAADLLYAAGKSKSASAMLLIATETASEFDLGLSLPAGIVLVRAPTVYIREALHDVLRS